MSLIWPIIEILLKINDFALIFRLDKKWQFRSKILIFVEKSGSDYFTPKLFYARSTFLRYSALNLFYTKNLFYAKKNFYAKIFLR